MDKIMQSTHPNDYYSLLKSAAKNISQTIKNSLSQTEAKEFMLWLLKDNNPHQENYLRMLGVAGSVELELKLFDKVFDHAMLKQMQKYISILNAYFAYETLSDNLGVGLAPCANNNVSERLSQKEVLLGFNAIMISKIKGKKTNIEKLLKPIAKSAKKISLSKNTLAPEQMQIFAEDYIRQKSSTSSSELEHVFLEILLLNIVTCMQLLESLRDSLVYRILKESLIARYSSVTSIVKYSNRASLKKLASWGLNSILTVPTLAYCIGSLEEIIPHPTFKIVIDNGLLYNAMADAALLTRLLNDVGTHLLTMDNKTRKAFYHQLQIYVENHQNSSIVSCLIFLSEQKEFFYPLTRIRKDLKNGEYNICLDHLRNDKSLNDSLAQFYRSVDYFAKLYQKTHSALQQKLSGLTEILGDDKASKIIYHFVEFHQMKYKMEYESMGGDYAITNN